MPDQQDKAWPVVVDHRFDTRIQEILPPIGLNGVWLLPAYWTGGRVIGFLWDKRLSEESGLPPSNPLSETLCDLTGPLSCSHPNSSCLHQPSETHWKSCSSEILILAWTELRSVHIPDMENWHADFFRCLCRDSGGEWSLHPVVFQVFCHIWGGSLT